jgi:hypothetical protein
MVYEFETDETDVISPTDGLWLVEISCEDPATAKLPREASKIVALARSRDEGLEMALRLSTVPQQARLGRLTITISPPN